MQVDLPLEFVALIERVFAPMGWDISKVRREAESGEYAAYRFVFKGLNIAFRAAKTTPTKVGQFVTLWKRPDDAIAPFDSGDLLDAVIISATDQIQRGYFVFTRDVLIARGIMSVNGKGGKRAIRVYPPWSTPVAKSAIKTQQWQNQYFGQGDIGNMRERLGI